MPELLAANLRRSPGLIAQVRRLVAMIWMQWAHDPALDEPPEPRSDGTNARTPGRSPGALACGLMIAAYTSAITTVPNLGHRRGSGGRKAL